MRGIFKWFTQDDSCARLSWFVDQFDEEMFDGVDKLLLLFLRYCADLDIPAYPKYFSVFMETEGKRSIRKYGVRLPMMENFNYSDPVALEEAYQVISAQAHTVFEDYCQEGLEDRTFKVDAKAYIDRHLNEKIQSAISESFVSLSAGGSPEDVADELIYTLDRVRAVFDSNSLAKLDFLEGRKTSTSNKKETMRKLFDTGIPCVDGDSGGMFSKQVWAFSGSPGSGKTRVAACYWAYPAMIAGLDVLFDELELSSVEVENMLIAHHIIQLFGGEIKIPDSEMNRGNLSAEQWKYYNAAKFDLFDSGRWGKITIRTDDLVVENFKKDTYSFLRRNRNTQLWIIDYAGLAKSVPIGKYAGRKDKYEVITELYEGAKDIAKTADIGVLVLNQFGKEGCEASLAGKRIMPGHVQGGQIIERHADYDIAMCMTEEQENASMRTFSTIKKRSAKGFQFVPFVIDAAVTILRQINQAFTA